MPIADIRHQWQRDTVPLMLSLLLAATSPAVVPCADGTWIFKASNQVVFRLDIHTKPSGTTAVWERPERFGMDGESIYGIGGRTIRRSAESVTPINGDLLLTFADPRPRATPDVFEVHCTVPNHLDALYEGMGFDPFDLVKGQTVGSPMGPWDPRQNYVPATARKTNAEMTAIYDADQADRRTSIIDWSVVSKSDQKRLERVDELLKSNSLQSGDDYYHAAFVFQHGTTSRDYLKAHLLATIAMIRGKPGAVWIASATLDRYLQSTGNPQVLGTQYKTPKGEPTTQEPYDRTLVSDGVRKVLHVPSITEQDKQRQEYDQETSASKVP